MLDVIKAYVPRILARLKDEYTAHKFYRTLANWCDNKGYLNAAKYYANEAEQELVHAQKLQKFLNDWGISYQMPTVADTFEIASLPDGLRKQYKLESDLYIKYNSDAVNSDTEVSTYQLFLGMVQIQYESVAESKTLLDRLVLIDETNKFQVAWYESEYFE
jgi:ferritin